MVLASNSKNKLYLSIVLQMLKSHCVQQDFPFSIRIPESVPPTITLDKSGTWLGLPFH